MKPSIPERRRCKTLPIRSLKGKRLKLEMLLTPEETEDRPQTRADCLRGGMNEERPCPYVGCRHHLYLDINPETGSIKFNFPELEVWEMEETCSLDCAGQGGITLERVGSIMNITRERTRQLENSLGRKFHSGGLDPAQESMMNGLAKDFLGDEDAERILKEKDKKTNSNHAPQITGRSFKTEDLTRFSEDLLNEDNNFSPFFKG
jgi:hypothetical protein